MLEALLNASLCCAETFTTSSEAGSAEVLKGRPFSMVIISGHLADDAISGNQILDSADWSLIFYFRLVASVHRLLYFFTKIDCWW